MLLFVQVEHTGLGELQRTCIVPRVTSRRVNVILYNSQMVFPNEVQ